MQTMYESGVLTVGTHNVSYAHDDEHLAALKNAYSSFLDKAVAIREGQSMKKFLKADPIAPLFKVR